MTHMTRAEQAECLRRYGHEAEAHLVESGQRTLPPDALATSWACLQAADALRELSAHMRRPYWTVTIREDGDIRTERVQADSELQAAFAAGKGSWRSAELVSVTRETKPEDKS
jgi:hypothetical protein